MTCSRFFSILLRVLLICFRCSPCFRLISVDLVLLSSYFSVTTSPVTLLKRELRLSPRLCVEEPSFLLEVVLLLDDLVVFFLFCFTSLLVEGVTSETSKRVSWRKLNLFSFVAGL